MSSVSSDCFLRLARLLVAVRLGLLQRASCADRELGSEAFGGGLTEELGAASFAMQASTCGSSQKFLLEKLYEGSASSSEEGEGLLSK